MLVRNSTTQLQYLEYIMYCGILTIWALEYPEPPAYQIILTPIVYSVIVVHILLK